MPPSGCAPLNRWDAAVLIPAHSGMSPLSPSGAVLALRVARFPNVTAPCVYTSGSHVLWAAARRAFTASSKRRLFSSVLLHTFATDLQAHECPECTKPGYSESLCLT